MTKEEKAKKVLQEWVNKQGHDRCWYYPEIFQELCSIFDVKATVEDGLPCREEFEKGCERYQHQEYDDR